MNRRITRAIRVGQVPVGGGAPVSIQSMCNTDTRDAAGTLAQIRRLAAAGCEIIRVAVPDLTAAEALREISGASPLPVVADIHFDHRLALAAIDAGAAAIRLNPGNIGGVEKVRQVAERAGAAGIPIRVGANSGSIDPALIAELTAAGMPLAEAVPEALVRSALEECAQLEQFGFTAIKVSLKASDVPAMVEACRRFAGRSDYPLHLGVTEAGTRERGTIKSAVGIGSLLLSGIGDTIRVSLTADPVYEIPAARRILESCGLRQAVPELVSCPTCGRTRIDLMALAEKVEQLIDSITASGRRIRLRKVAVMGCVVNGPGEARDADWGVAGGDGKLVLFRHGEVVGTFSEEAGFARLKAAIEESAEPQE
ncbi:MAG: flavodoxin-dependent (E)-4-hydroxy-3-methylbut-2-enyl-diphosphate synthase [Lentisphaeria bacterium]|nr:flavodoxin-dependent (E)-4-hydroxy-3-methylbut-2-enyl-diphosphate synthase [Lentisphaeria bacterium]